MPSYVPSPLDHSQSDLKRRFLRGMGGPMMPSPPSSASLLHQESSSSEDVVAHEDTLVPRHRSKHRKAQLFRKAFSFRKKKRRRGSNMRSPRSSFSTSNSRNHDNARAETNDSSSSTLARYISNVDQLQEAIDRLSSQVDQLSEVAALILSSVSVGARNGHQESFSALVDAIDNGSMEVQDGIARLRAETQALVAGDHEVSDAIARTRQSAHVRLVSSFTLMMSHFSTVLEDYRAQHKRAIRDQLCLLDGVQASQEDVDILIGGGHAAQKLLDQLRRKDAMGLALTTLQENHADVKLIESRMIDLHQAFVELALLIEKQAEPLSRAGAKTAHVRELASAARITLAQTERRSNSNRRKYIAIAMLLAAIVGIIAAFLLILCVALFVITGGAGALASALVALL